MLVLLISAKGKVPLKFYQVFCSKLNISTVVCRVSIHYETQSVQSAILLSFSKISKTAILFFVFLINVHCNSKTDLTQCQ